MAQLTGKLGADFSPFYDAVTKADAYITDLSAGADRAGTRLNAMQDSLSGKVLVQQATLAAEAVQRVGGVSQLTTAELQKLGAQAQQAVEKLQAMGKDVPAGIQKIADASKAVQQETTSLVGSLGHVASALGIAFSAEAIVAFAKEAVFAAATLEDLSKATGVSLDGLQRLQFVGVEAGLGVAELAKGVEQLSAKLAGGDANATTAVKLLGLNLQELLTAGPQEAFIQIAEAAGRIDDPMTKGAIAADLFGGRLAKQLIPILGDLRTQMAAVPKEALISDANILKAKEFSDGLEHAKTKLEAWTVSVLGAASSYSKWLESGSGLSGFLDLIHGKTAQATDDHAKQAAAVKTTDEATIHLTTTVKDQIEADKLLAEEQKMVAAMLEIDSAGQSWQETLQTIDGAVVEAIKGYIDAGVSQGALATAYGLTAAQVKAVTSAMRDSAEALKVEEKATADSATRWAQYTATKVQLSGSTTQKLNAEIDVWVAKEIESHVKAKTDTQDFYTWLGAQATASRELQDRQRLLSDSSSRTSYEQRKTAAEDWFQFVMAHTSEFTNADIDQAAKRTQAATQEWATWGAVSSAALDKTIAKEKELHAAAAAAMAAMGSSITYDLSTTAGVEAYKAANTGMNVSWSDAQIVAFIAGGGTLQDLFKQGVITMKPYAQGGPTTAGPAMLHDAEYVVPKDGALVSGGGRIGPVTIHVMLPDGQTLASVMMAELTRGMMQDRLWPARA